MPRASLAIVVLLACCACTGYFAPGGAALYCKDREGKMIRCPSEPTPKRDTTATDTTHGER